MKKFSIMFATAILLFASCEGPAGRDGLDGRDGASFEFYVKNFTVVSRDWVYLSSGRYTDMYEYVVDIDVKKQAYEYGTVSVYMYQLNTASNSEVQTPLPYWTQHTAGENTWLEGYNFDFDEGTVAFYAEVEKGTYPPTSLFRIVIAP
jgi:hypothetical protein